MSRPDRSEYADYYHLYVARVADGEIVDILSGQHRDSVARLRKISEARGDYRYAEGKWSVKELIGHLADTERVMGFRALAFARGDRTPLPGFEQNDYVANGNFGTRTIADLAAELDALRASHLPLFRSFDDETWLRRGIANRSEFTTRAVAWIMAGHLIHHLAVLEERYL